MQLKNIIIQSSDESFSEKQIIETLEFTMNFLGNNSHKYFTYVHIYWLSQYFDRTCRIIHNPKKIEYYKKHLSQTFPKGYF